MLCASRYSAGHNGRKARRHCRVSLNNRYGFDIGYYRTSNINQYYQTTVVQSSPTDAATAGVNSGDIVNRGVELTAFAVPVRNDNFEWRTTVNFATNKNKVEKLFASDNEDLVGLDFFALSPKGVNTFGSYLVEGGSFGDIYGQELRRNENGLPIVDMLATHHR